MSINLGIVFSAKDLASGVMGQMQKKFDGLGKSIDGALKKKMAVGAAGFVAGLGLMTAGVKVAATPLSFVQTAADFEASMVKMQSVTGFTGKAFEDLKKKAIKLGVETQFAPEEAVEAMKALGTAGLNAQQVLDSIDATVAFAGASQGALTMDNAAVTLSATLNAFQIPANKASDVVNKLTRITQISSIQFQDLEGIIASSGSVAKSTNQSFETFLATIGLIKSQGGTARDASNKFRIAMMQLQGATTPVKKGLAAIGLEMTDLRDAKTGNFKELPDIFDQISRNVDKASKNFSNLKDKQEQFKGETLTRIFGKQGIQAFNKVLGSTIELTKKDLDLLKEHNPALRARVETFRDQNGAIKNVLKGTDALRFKTLDLETQTATAEKANQSYLKTYEGLIKLLQGSWQTIKLTLGTPLLAAAKNGLGFVLNNILNPFLKWMQDAPGRAKGVVNMFFAIGGGLIFLGAALAGVSGWMAVNALLVAFETTLIGVATAAGAMLAPLVGPFLIVAGIIAAAVIAWKTNLGGFGDFVQHMVSQTKLVWRSLVAMFKGESVGKIKGFEFMAEGTKTLVKWLMKAKQMVMDFGRGAMDTFNNMNGPEVIKMFSEALGEFVSLTAQIIMDVIKMGAKISGLGTIFDGAGDGATTFGSVLSAMAVLAISAITGIIRMASWILDKFRMVSNFFATDFGSAILQGLTLVAQPLMLLIGIPIKIAQNWDKVKAGVDLVWQAIITLGDSMVTMGSIAKSFFTGDFSAVKAKYDDFFSRIKERFTTTQQEAATAGQNIAGNIAAGLDPANQSIDSMANKSQKMADQLNQAANNANKAGNGAQNMSSALEQTSSSAGTIEQKLQAIQAAAGTMNTGVTQNTQTMTQNMQNQTAAASQAMVQEIQKIGPASQSAAASVQNNFSTVPATMANLGSQSGTSFVDNMIVSLNAGRGRLAAAVAALINSAIASQAKGQSPPPEGPMKDIDKWGIPLMEAYADGIRKGAATPQLAIKTALAASVPGSDAGPDFRVAAEPTRVVLPGEPVAREFTDRPLVVPRETQANNAGADAELREMVAQMAMAVNQMALALADRGAGSGAAPQIFLDGKEIAARVVDRIDDDDRREVLF